MDAAPYQYQAWPAWATSPDGSESRVFDSEAEVPAGWTYPGGVKHAKGKKSSAARAAEELEDETQPVDLDL